MVKKILNTKAKKRTALFLSLAILVSTLAIGLNATLAAYNQESATFTRPDNGYTRDIFVNEPSTEAPHSLSASGTSIADFSNIDTSVIEGQKAGSAISLNVKKAGTATIVYTTANGMSGYRKYQAIDRSNIVSYAIDSKAQKSVKENAPAFAIPITVTTLTDTTAVNDTAKSALLWQSSNDDVATVSGNTVTPKTKGIANLKATVIDPWGISHDIYFTLGVGINIDDSLMGNLIDAINDAEKISNQTPPLYTSDTLNDLQDALDAAKDIANKADPTESELNTAISSIQDAIDALEALQGDGTGSVITGSDGNSYKEVSDTSGKVVEKLDENGNSTVPPTYLYDPDGSIANDGTVSGDEKDAYNIGGGYYVEDPAGSGIFKEIGDDGSLIDSPAIWAGADGVLGTSDDRAVQQYGDGNYYVDLGNNVFQQVTGIITGNGLVGGGADKDPSTDPAVPIEQINGVYYVKSTTETDPQAYYGDPATDGDGSLDSSSTATAGDDVTYYIDDEGNLTTEKPSTAIVDGQPTGVTGRTLTTTQTGDTSEWIEIARNGGYSLIVRSTSIGIITDGFGGTASYSSSYLRDEINNWFLNSSNSSSKLSWSAQLRDYTVTSDVMSKIGTFNNTSLGSDTYGEFDGFSVPTGIAEQGIHTSGGGTGTKDIAFPLSNGEAARFCGVQWYGASPLSGWQACNDIAKANWAALADETSVISWLRSPGNSTGHVTYLNTNGRVTSDNRTISTNYVRPACWVNSDIFNK